MTRSEYKQAHHDRRWAKWVNRNTERSCEYSESFKHALAHSHFVEVPACPCCMPERVIEKDIALRTARTLFMGSGMGRAPKQRHPSYIDRLRYALEVVGYAGSPDRLRLTDLRVATDIQQRRMLAAADACAAAMDRLLEHAA